MDNELEKQMERSNAPNPATERMQSAFAAVASLPAYDPPPMRPYGTIPTGPAYTEIPNPGSRRHHLLRHTLPPEASGVNALHHFGASSVKEALQMVHAMSQRELQQAFERVYNVKSSSNNNNWLRKKLMDALVPKNSPTDPEIEAYLDQMTAGTNVRKRQKDAAFDDFRTAAKEYTAALYSAGSGGDGGYYSYQQSKQKQSRKQSSVRPSPMDDGYVHHDDDLNNHGDQEGGAPTNGRARRKAAAGVAAATAAVLRDPTLEAIEKEDLRRASSGEYMDRRFGTGAGMRGKELHRYGSQHQHHHAPPPPPPPPMWPGQYHHHAGGGAYPPPPPLPMYGGDYGVDHRAPQGSSDQMQQLSQLLQIAVQQGKLNPAALNGAGGGYGQPYHQAPPPPPLLHLQFSGSVSNDQSAINQLLASLGAPPPAAAPAPAWGGQFGGQRVPSASASVPSQPAAAALARLLQAIAQQSAAGGPQAEQMRQAGAVILQQVMASRSAAANGAAAVNQPQQDIQPKVEPLSAAVVPPPEAIAEPGPTAPTTTTNQSIPGSTFPVDPLLAQLLQQQQKASSGSPSAAEGAAPPAAMDNKSADVVVAVAQKQTEGGDTHE